MRKIVVDIFLKIMGISAVSGITFSDSAIHLISDLDSALYTYEQTNSKLEQTDLIPETDSVYYKNGVVNLPKKIKPDFEALYENDSLVYVFGSGSKPNRNFGYKINKSTMEYEFLDLSWLYDSMRDFAGMDEKDFNIEGVTFARGEWYFFNRGNGPESKNMIFTVQGENLVDDFNVFHQEYELPEINGHISGFSDATAVNGVLYFIATAEGTKSTYNDGEILGTMLGAIPLKDMEITFTQKISDTHKFEGITVYQKSPRKIEFLLSEDNDTDNQEATIYKMSMDVGF